MSQIRQRVNASGVLRGEGQEATCTVLMTKVTKLIGGKPVDSIYIEHEIINVSNALPQGIYELNVRDENFLVRRRNGGWIAIGPCLAGDVAKLTHYEEETQSEKRAPSVVTNAIVAMSRIPIHG